MAEMEEPVVVAARVPLEVDPRAEEWRYPGVQFNRIVGLPVGLPEPGIDRMFLYPT